MTLIEKGRHLKIEKDKSYCPVCPGIVETEKHFILFCKTFTLARKTLFSEARKLILDFEVKDEMETFKILLCDETVLHLTGTFLYKSLYTRTFLVKNPKNTE